MNKLCSFLDHQFQLKDVYSGNTVFLEWIMSLEAAVKVHYTTPSGKQLVTPKNFGDMWGLLMKHALARSTSNPTRYYTDIGMPGGLPRTSTGTSALRTSSPE